MLSVVAPRARVAEMKQYAKNITSKKVINLILVSIAIGTLITSTVVGRAGGAPATTFPTHGSVSTAPARVLERGVNWIGASWAHSEQSIIERDFTKFESDELSLVSLQIHLVNVCPTTDPYVYDDSTLANLVEACQRAYNHGLKVLVTMYTSFDPTYGMLNPPWMADPCDGSRGAKCIVGSDQMGQYYKDMFTHIVDYLVAHNAPVWAWAVMNEPFAWCGGGAGCVCGGNEARRQRGLQLFSDMSQIVKSRAPSHLVTCRFIPQIMGDRCWRWDPIIMNSFDFIMLSGYQEVNYVQPITYAISQGKEVHIYEFGMATSDSAAQASHYQYHLQRFVDLGVSGCFAFEWVPNAGVGSGYNICADSAGNGRPAYDELITH